jgi:inhibitor of cysteine peptidase
MKKVVVVLILIILLTACSKAVKPNDPQVSIETSAGKEFKVILPSNPSTGYHWEIVGELDKNVVEFVSQDYRADEPVLAGSGGSDVWVFKAVAPGETTITLGYYPPSNDPTDPQETKTFSVIVK